MKQIGIDIGGTHTDAVLVDGKTIIATAKVLTQKKLHDGVVASCREVLQKSKTDPADIGSVQIGTTVGLNAILEEKELLKVGVIRLAPYTPALLAGASWPQSLAQKVIGEVVVIPGGFDCRGKALAQFQKEKAKGAILKLLDVGVEAFSITSIFSPLRDEQEKAVQALVEELAGKNFPVTISSQIGGIGLLERENGAILNSALKKVVQEGFKELETEVCRMGIGAPLFMVQNDGTIMGMKKAVAFPLLTIASGQTNSFRGAQSLVGGENLIVIDVGGTSCDIGVIKNGEPLRTLGRATLGGVTLFLPMTDTFSLSLGGGTVIRGDLIGPDSVGRALFQEARCFGGDTLTLTDIGVLLGHLEIATAQKEKVGICCSAAKNLLAQVETKVRDAVFKVQGKGEHIPLVIVGGGAPLLKNLAGVIPEYAYCANGYGACLAQISAKKEKLLAFEGRQALLDQLKEEALKEAVQEGADPKTIKIVNVEEVPCAYSKEGLCRFIVTASGPKSSLQLPLQHR